MKAEDLTGETLPKALRIMRLSAELTQTALAMRTSKLKPPLKRLRSEQISDFERGAKRPTSVNLISIVVGCSPDGATLDFSLLQWAFEEASASEGETRKGSGGSADEE